MVFDETNSCFARRCLRRPIRSFRCLDCLSGHFLSASLLVEVVLGWPGLGPMLLESILARDVYVVIAVVLLSAALVILGSLFADVLLYWSDPRIRTDAR